MSKKEDKKINKTADAPAISVQHIVILPCPFVARKHRFLNMYTGLIVRELTMSSMA